MQRRGFIQHIGRSAAALGASTWCGAAFAADGALSAKQITFGTSTALSGPLGPSGVEQRDAIRAAFASVNKAGGIHGRELRLVARDDAYDPRRSAENVQSLIDNGQAFAFLSQIGTAPTAAVIPLLERAGVPLLGPVTGSSSVRSSQHRYVFHVRPGYAEEVRRMVRELVEMGLTDIAFVYLDNGFGREVIGEAQRVMAEKRVKTAGNFPLDLDGKNAEETARRVVEASAGAVFLAAAGHGAIDFVIHTRKLAAGLPMIGMSVTFSDLARLTRERVNGLATAAVFPAQTSKKFALVRAFDASMSEAGYEPKVGSGIESWINAQVLIEGLRRAGRDVTRDKLRSALSGIRSFNLHELTITMSSNPPYIGNLPVEMSVMGPDYKFRT